MNTQFTKKHEAKAEAARLAAAGHTVAIVETMIKRMPAPFKNICAWNVVEVTA